MSNTFIAGASAQNLDAGAVLDKMDTKQKNTYVAGIVEGLAYARFLKDKPDQTGHKCVSQWMDGDAKQSWRKILSLFKRHRDKPPAVLLYVLVKKDCGA